MLAFSLGTIRAGVTNTHTAQRRKADRLGGERRRRNTRSISSFAGVMRKTVTQATTLGNSGGGGNATELSGPQMMASEDDGVTK